MHKLEVIIDGIKYAPVATSVKIYFMHDNHAFEEITGDTLECIVEKATNISNESHYGMLCSAKVFSGDKEIRSVGSCVHHSPKRLYKWAEDCASWIQTLRADPDVVRLLASRNES